MLLYTISAKLFSIFVDADKRVKGIQIGDPGTLLNSLFWRGGLGISHKDTQLNSLKIKWIQRLLNLTNALWKDLILYRLNLILNSNQSLTLFR